MKLLWPWALLWLLPIAAAAFWALARPTERVVLVGSLRLWVRALEALGPAVKKARRLTAGWLLLLAGAAAAAIALSRPTWYAEAPARRIAVAVWPGAELAGLPPETLAEITGVFLRRLSPKDRVRLILPTVLERMSDFVSPDEAARRIREIQYLPIPAENLTLPTGVQNVQHVYRFVPATLDLEDGPGTTTITLPARPGEVTIDAFAVSNISEKSIQVFLAVRNHTAAGRRGEVLIAGSDASPIILKYDLSPGDRRSLIAEPAGGDDYYLASIAGAAGPGAAAFAACRPRRMATVAIIGRDDPHIRRFVRINPALRLVGDPHKADAVIAIGKAAPAGIAALLIDPPMPPTGWRKDKLLENFALRDADVAADHPILAHVDLAAVAIRRSAAWSTEGGPPQQRLASIANNSLILAGTNPPRVWLAFDTAVENTNFAMTESFVIFMANVVKYLVPHAHPEVTYEYVTPLQAGPQQDWKPLKTGTYAPRPPTDNRPLPEPGLYRNDAGDLHAVSLTGLKSARPQTDPQQRIAEIALPAPQPLAKGVELWGVFALAAALLWLAGWAVRLR